MDAGKPRHEAVHVCHKCRWQFPNAHPSSRHRRAHKKICGTIEGYKLVVPNGSDQKTPSPRDMEKSINEKGSGVIGEITVEKINQSDEVGYAGIVEMEQILTTEGDDISTARESSTSSFGFQVDSMIGLSEDNNVGSKEQLNSYRSKSVPEFSSNLHESQVAANDVTDGSNDMGTVSEPGRDDTGVSNIDSLGFCFRLCSCGLLACLFLMHGTVLSTQSAAIDAENASKVASFLTLVEKVGCSEWSPSLTNESPGRNKEEIIAKVTNWSSGKQRTPLKSLISLETKHKSPIPALMVQKDDTAAKDNGDETSTVNSILATKSSVTTPQIAKEWNSPARYPSEIKRKAKGRPIWAQFVCCSSLN